MPGKIADRLDQRGRAAIPREIHDLVLQPGARRRRRRLQVYRDAILRVARVARLDEEDEVRIVLSRATKVRDSAKQETIGVQSLGCIHAYLSPDRIKATGPDTRQRESKRYRPFSVNHL